MSGLTLKNVSKNFEKTVVLDNISLDLPERELLVLLGPSGCGKSTLLRLIAGLEETDEGEIFINNKRVDKLSPRKRNVALVFQNYSLYPHMTVEQNLSFPLKVIGTGRGEIKHRVDAVAHMLDLHERLDNKPGQLSGGQRQRVALGRAIVKKPSIFLLDEPLSNLDADLRVRMRQEIVRLQKELGVTMVYVTHDQEEALTMGDRIALLHEGKIQQIGTPEQLYKQPSNRFVAEFIGQPKINIISGQVRNGMLTPIGLDWAGYEKLTGGTDKVTIGIRPEAIRLAGAGLYAARVTACEYLGNHYVVSLLYGHNSGEETLTVTNVLEPYEPGQDVRFNFERSALMFFDIATGVRYRVG